jgi:hypothetical protein
MSFNNYKEFKDHLWEKYSVEPDWVAKLAWDHQQEIINVLRAAVLKPPSPMHIWTRTDIFGETKYYTTEEVKEAFKRMDKLEGPGNDE